MTPARINERLDERGMLDDASKPGVYALEVTVPDSHERVQREWLAINDHIPFDGTLPQLAGASRVLYVGATKRTIRERLEEHARKHRRKSMFVRLWPIEDVYGIWPHDAPEDGPEYNRARELSDEPGIVAWCNGVLFG